MRILKKIWYRIIKKSPGDMDMVHYWKTKDHVEAKITTRDGATIMVLDGEKYPIWGFPRGHLLIPANEPHGPLSILKHQVKVQIFNEIWEKLEKKLPKDQIIKEGYEALDRVIEYLEPLKYDLMPASTMCPSVREIHRAWTKVAPSERSLKVRDIVCLTLQEDDGYRYRVQWMAIWYPWVKWFYDPIKLFDKGLMMIERAEVIGDMKRKIKLLRRVLMLALEDPNMKDKFTKLFKEIDWNKVRIKEEERYHFRAKYFKCDLDVLEY